MVHCALKQRAVIGTYTFDTGSKYETECHIGIAAGISRAELNTRRKSGSTRNTYKLRAVLEAPVNVFWGITYAKALIGICSRVEEGGYFAYTFKNTGNKALSFVGHILGRAAEDLLAILFEA